MKIRMDLHSHTYFSYDAITSPEEMVRRYTAAGIGCVAVTDHHEIRGALLLREMAPFRVIVGEEIRSTGGDIIGLFLRETIPEGLSPAETLDEIRRQGGVSYLPHPFGRRGLSRTVMAAFSAPDILDRLDVVEAFNSRNLTDEANRLARAFAERHGLRLGAGSDAHTPFEIGNAFVVAEEFDAPIGLLAALRGAEIVGRRTPLALRAALNNRLRRRVGAWRRRATTSGGEA